MKVLLVILLAIGVVSQTFWKNNRVYIGELETEIQEDLLVVSGSLLIKNISTKGYWPMISCGIDGYGCDPDPNPFCQTTRDCESNGGIPICIGGEGSCIFESNSSIISEQACLWINVDEEYLPIANMDSSSAQQCISSNKHPWCSILPGKRKKLI